MSLRITQGHLFSRALRDIHNGLSNITRLQQQVASGRRVNAPSDDPVAALRILPLNGEIRDLRRMVENAQLAREVLSLGSSSLEHASEAMQRARELAVQAANGTRNEGDRASIAGEIDQLLRQMVSIANTDRGGRFLFGGTATDSPPFELVEDGGGTRVVYRGNRQGVSVQVAPSVQTTLNMPGDGIFLGRDRGATRFQGDTGAAPTGAGDTGVGFQTLEVTFNGLHTDAPPEITAGSGATTALGPLGYAFTATPPTLSIDGGPALPVPATDQDFTTGDGRVINLSVSAVPATLAGTFTAKAGLSIDGGASVADVSDFTDTSALVRDSFDGTVLNVDVTGLSQTGREQVEYEGTFDVFTVLISLRDALRNPGGASEEEVRQRVSGLLDEIDGAHEEILDGLRELGFRTSAMDALQERVEGIELSRTKELSRVQDTDISQAILELQHQDIIYQAALQIGARVIQTSLQRFLG